ncbi:MAG: hypothetical protein NT169_08860, partial [Chloroflexi bacterium]|nr:hypothetical protein [Chloroflexota bacterium]
IRHQDANTVYFTGRPRDWVDELAVDHANPATWSAAQAATGLTLAELGALLDDNARQIAELRPLLATPVGLAAWLDRLPSATPVGLPQGGWPTPVATTTANYLQAVGIGPRVATRSGAGSLAVIVERPLPRRLEARCAYPAPFWVRALEWQIAEHLAHAKRETITAAQACDCLERALAWEQIVRIGPARPGGYRRMAERLDAWYN